MEKGARTRCNASMLTKLKGKKVCLLGKVTNVDRAQKSFNITSPDDINLKITMKDQVMSYPKGLCEIYGNVDVNGNVLCESFTMFDEENLAQFDLAQYNEAITLVSKLPNFYITK